MSGVLLITGASRGIGAATALLGAQRGYAICVNYFRDHAAARSVVESVESKGGHALAAQADVADERQVENLFRRVDAELGPLTALVNNAGVLAPQGRVQDIDVARLGRVFGTNVFGAMLCAREAVKRLSTAHGGLGGAIVNVSSAAARLGAPNEYIDYAASKGALDTFTIGLAKEVARDGIRVNAVRPAFIDTDIHASGGDPDRVARLASLVPMRRGGQPEEVAQAILWLLSEQASYVTGTFIELAGGC